MPKFPNINTLLFKAPQGDEKIQISATEYTTLLALAGLTFKGTLTKDMVLKVDPSKVDLKYLPEVDDSLEEILTYIFTRMGINAQIVCCYNGSLIWYDDIADTLYSMGIDSSKALVVSYLDLNSRTPEQLANSWTPEGLYQLVEHEGQSLQLTHPDTLKEISSNETVVKPGDVILSTAPAPQIKLLDANWARVGGAQYTASVMVMNANITKDSISCETGTVFFSEAFDLAPDTDAQLIAIQMYFSDSDQSPVFVINKCGYEKK